MPIRVDTGKLKGVTGVQMARMRKVLVPYTKEGNSATRMGGGGNLGRVAKMDQGDMQQCGTVGRGKGQVNVCTRPLTANSCNSHGKVTGLRTRTGGNAAESFLPVVMSTHAQDYANR
jgi:hypothetical protein